MSQSVAQLRVVALVGTLVGAVLVGALVGAVAVEHSVVPAEHIMETRSSATCFGMHEPSALCRHGVEPEQVHGWKLPHQKKLSVPASPAPVGLQVLSVS